MTPPIGIPTAVISRNQTASFKARSLRSGNYLCRRPSNAVMATPAPTLTIATALRRRPSYLVRHLTLCCEPIVEQFVDRPDTRRRHTHLSGCSTHRSEQPQLRTR
jgi:hypothetical protein